MGKVIQVGVAELVGVPADAEEELLEAHRGRVYGEQNMDVRFGGVPALLGVDILYVSVAHF